MTGSPPLAEDGVTGGTQPQPCSVPCPSRGWVLACARVWPGWERRWTSGMAGPDKPWAGTPERPGPGSAGRLGRLHICTAWLPLLACGLGGPSWVDRCLPSLQRSGSPPSRRPPARPPPCLLPAVRTAPASRGDWIPLVCGFVFTYFPRVCGGAASVQDTGQGAGSRASQEVAAALWASCPPGGPSAGRVLGQGSAGPCPAPEAEPPGQMVGLGGVIPDPTCRGPGL